MKAHGPERQAAGANRPISVDLAPLPRRAVAICAHPDDSEFFVAGTFAKWAAAGCECTYVVMTDGSLGSWGEHSPDELVWVRQAEQQQAAVAAGVKNVEFLGYEDGFLEATLDVRRRLVATLRRLRPDVVLTHDPWKAHRLHPDHRQCGFVACDAVATAREPHAWPSEGGAAHRPAQLLLFETDVPDHFEDVSATIDVKLAALLEHRSQYRSTMGAAGPEDTAALDAFRARVRSWAAEAGAAAGLAVAEAFKTLET